MKRFAKRQDLVTRDIGGETIIVPIEGHVGDLDSIYTLNEVASTVWCLIDGARTADAIARALCDRYEVTLEEARQDVDDLLASLEEAGLILDGGQAAGGSGAAGAAGE